MYRDPYGLEVSQMKLDPTEMPKFLTLTNKARMGLRNKKRRQEGLYNKVRTSINKYPLESPDHYWGEWKRDPLISTNVKDALQAIGVSSSILGPSVYALYQSELNNIEQTHKLANSLLRTAGLPEITTDQDIYEYFSEHPHPILNADNLYMAASDRDLLNKLNANKNE